ncbi:hypothetical protein, partial [Terrabacter carboxydivorans]|uniref:hypothetical protein n=1 Tax=Terrabacter carboxydivorans TaxID=619730 RepID=UPI0031E246DD
MAELLLGCNQHNEGGLSGVTDTGFGTYVGVSTTLENEAIATVENEATQTDWMGDLSGGLGSDPAAGRRWCAA